MFEPVDTRIPFSKVESSILEFWEQERIPQRMRESRPNGERWVVYEGPPTANNRPALHHVWTSLYKDVYPRFQVMRGRRVERRGGWDCQGLPVELQIEKDLGFTRKDQIEQHGIGDFNARCQALVQRYVSDFETIFRQIGYWVDLDTAYRTMDSDYIESVWWHLKTLWEQGFMYEGGKVVPYCIRCETALSSHELGQPEVYQDIPGPSLYIRFRLLESDIALVIWTTTPWTLIANVAVAVNPKLTYGVFELNGDKLLMSLPAGRETFELGDPIETVSGADLIGRLYQRPLEALNLDKNVCRVIPDDDIEIEQGTGLVHISPAFGESDNQLGTREGLPAPNHITADGTIMAGVEPWGGMTIQEVNPLITENLQQQGLLLRGETRVHSYPHCWRCKEPLIYRAKPSWFIRTSDNKHRLIKENDKVNWYPENIKYGRFGNWLENNIDWALSRDRYWGTPLPIWRCANGHDTCVGSRNELGNLSGRDLSSLDLHRPAVDDVSFPCQQCNAEAQRLPPVCDVWLDSGCMPAAQQAFPYNAFSEERFRNNFPADFICESLDQTRGWFYSLLAVNTLVFGETPYRNAVCLGLLVDDEGRKMSKSRGNVIDPNDLIPRFGADAVRWYLINSGSPWVPKRISFDAIEQGAKRVLRTFWNSYAFFVTYANLEAFSPAAEKPKPVTILDRWLASRETRLLAEVTDAYEGYDALTASQHIEEFVDDLSNWYIRRSRERFWGTSGASDTAAFEALYSALLTLSKAIAPICPFISEMVFRNLTNGQPGADSIHLADWPTVQRERIDYTLEQNMQLLRKAVSLTRSVRTDAKVKTRQPLRRVVIQGFDALEGELEKLFLDEVNVKGVHRSVSMDDLLDFEAKINFRSVGKRLGSQIPLLQDYLATAELDHIANALAADGRVEVILDGEIFDLRSDDITISRVAREGWAFGQSSKMSVALDMDIDDELLEEGAARELIRLIQKQRQTAGLEISDRIELWVTAPVSRSLESVAQAVLADAVYHSMPPDNLAADLQFGDGFAFRRSV